MKEALCKNCGDTFVYHASSTGKYCSNKCQMAYQSMLVDRQIVEANGKPEGVGEARMKRFLIESRGAQCIVCEGVDWMGSPIPLVMDHIDGNAVNWSLQNLRLICCNCDAQTDTYKGKNRGNGRHSRRARYAEGKSY